MPAVGEHLCVGERQGFRRAGAAAGELEEAEFDSAVARGLGEWMQCARVPQYGGAERTALGGERGGGFGGVDGDGDRAAVEQAEEDLKPRRAIGLGEPHSPTGEVVVGGGGAAP